MSETSVHDRVEHMAEMKASLQRTGFLARERPLDDQLDSETWTALYQFSESRGIPWSLDAFEAEDGVIPPAVSAALLDPMAMLSFSSVADADGELIVADEPEQDLATIDHRAVEVFDYFDAHALNEAKVKRKARDPSEVDTIVLHQTGVKFGVGARAVAKYGRRDALHRRFWDVACHVAALMNGDVLLINPYERYVLHGHRSNRFSLGIEIEGLYAGIVDKPNTVAGHRKGKTGNPLTKRTLSAARRAVQICVEEGRARGMPISKIAAHRQYHGSRISDPGQGIWQGVALWACETFGLEVDYDFAVQNKQDPRKSGLKIPKDWDPKGTVKYNGKPL